jgi:GWxTD domain-containing protein
MNHPVAEALGWALFHFLWQGAAIAIALAAALCFCRTARIRYLLAAAAMAAMVLAFAATLVICWPAAMPHGLVVRTAATLPLPPRPDRAAAGAIDTLRQWTPPVWFVPVWLGGVSLFYLYSLLAWVAASRLKTRGAFAAPAAWSARMQELSAILGLRRRIALLESCLAEVPVVIGYLRPVILMPVGMLAGLSAEQVEAVLIHELAHIRRFDYLVNVVQTLVEGLLFYHPAVWWTGSVMRREREHCCDDVVVALQGDARGYAATLARLELSRGTAREPALAATGGNLMKRIHRLLQQPEGTRVAAPLVSAAMLLAAAGLAVAAWQTQPQTQPQPQRKQSTPPAQPDRHLVEPLPQHSVEPLPREAPKEAVSLQTPYQKWLTQDVAYIITDAERATFKALPSDAEREQFIEQFWLIRDPTPGTVYNEFKSEHYRRVAYTNEHFTTKNALPGWKTDRGRVYITYGPPDEIEDHAAAGTTTAFQQWRYKFIEGVGTNVIIEFVDPTSAGEYRMTMDPKEKDAIFDGRQAPNEFERLEQFAKMQKAPASPLEHSLAITVRADPIPPIAYGVRDLVTEVQSQNVSISAPIETHGHPATVVTQVTTLNGRMVGRRMETLPTPNGHYSTSFGLVPGPYRARVTVTDKITGQVRQGEVPVEVK